MIDAPNRIAELRKARRLTQDDLASRLGVHRVTIAKLERGKIDLTLNWMTKIAQALGDIAPQDLISSQAGESILIVGAVQAGHWAEHAYTDENDEPNFVTMPVLNELLGVPKRASRVVGNSMNELYPDGSIVVWLPFLNHPEPLKPGRRYIVERTRAGAYEVTLKEFRVDQTGREWLVPRTTDPAEQTPLQVYADDGETIRVVGRVIWASRIEEP